VTRDSDISDEDVLLQQIAEKLLRVINPPKKHEVRF
jgi:hypothetical protein